MFEKNGQRKFQQLDVDNKRSPTMRWVTPLVWIRQMMVKELQSESAQPPYIAAFVVQLAATQESIRKLFCYDWITLPLVYTQGFCRFGTSSRRPTWPASATSCSASSGRRRMSTRRTRFGTSASRSTSCSSSVSMWRCSRCFGISW